MAVPRLGGPSVGLPTFPGLAVQTVGANAGQIKGLTNAITLAAGETFNIPPGTYWVKPGQYTFLQWLDPVTGLYKVRPTAADNNYNINSDGTNFRLANTTGCPIAAVITTGGTGYTTGIGTGPAVTVSSGASTWQTVVGGMIGATLVTATGTTTAGSGYLYIPQVIIDAPPTGGLQATAIVTSLSTGTIPVANIQVINQGAGYTIAPNVTFVNDPRDTVGGGAVVVTTLTATGAITALYPTNHGTPLTGVPTLTFASGAAAATVLMNWTVTGWTQTAGGSSLGNATVVSVSNKATAQTLPGINPDHVNGVTFPRPCRINANIAAGVATNTGALIEDGGLGIQQVPGLAVIYAITSTTAIVPQFTAATVGGVNDTSYIQPC